MISLLMVGLAASLLGGQETPGSDHVIFQDAERDVRIRYDFTPAGVEFAAHLPEGWDFDVAIDGDQDGRWGDVPENGQITSHPTADRKYGPNSQHTALCAQYILAPSPRDPGRVAISSHCGAFPSQGSFEMSGVDADRRATITLRIPMQEVFGDRLDTHLQICLWDMQRMSCRYTPAEPFVLRRPDASTPR